MTGGRCALLYKRKHVTVHSAARLQILIDSPPSLFIVTGRCVIDKRDRNLATELS